MRAAYAFFGLAAVVFVAGMMTLFNREVASGEAVCPRVFRRAGLAFWLAWSGAVLRIGSVGFESCW